jgi:hypothetical protein
LNQLWCKNTIDALAAENQGCNTRQNYIIQKPGVEESFSVAKPLSHINGFEDDNDEVIYGFKHSLVLKRSRKSALALSTVLMTTTSLSYGNVPFSGTHQTNTP